MRSWLTTSFALTLALFAALAAFNLSADVFGVFGTRLVAHNLGPLEMRLTTSGDRVIKGLEFLGKTKPLDIVFIGSSRTVNGFDPHSPTMAGLNSYNLGLNGSKSDEAAIILRYVASHGTRVSRVIWSIDFEEFFRPNEQLADFDDSIFAGVSPWRGRAMHSLSYEALRKTVTGLMGKQAWYIDTDGFYHYALQDRHNLITGDDFWELPSMRAWFPGYMASPQDNYVPKLEDRLERIVDAIRFARARGVAVDLALPPVHVSRRAIYDLLGYGERFQSWKKALAQAASVAAEGPGAPVRIFDFTEVGPVATHAFKRGGPLERSPYFFEILHFRPSVGDMIVARLLDRPWPDKDIPPFGAPLTETTTNASLAADAAAVHAWEQANPDLMARIRTIMENVKKQLAGS